MNVQQFCELVEKIGKLNDDRFRVYFVYDHKKERCFPWGVAVEEVENDHLLLSGVGSTPDDACAKVMERLKDVVTVLWGYKWPEGTDGDIVQDHPAAT